ncbi:MAG: hypothetical protein JWR08_1959 [Enterovirga sp.]|jgi:hypothetical protein|nr:hypothetical protein [Enterovirga sp.]
MDVPWNRRRPPDSDPALFGALRRLTHSLATDGDRRRKGLRSADFEEMSDHLVVVRPGANLGGFQFDFYGAAVAELGTIGDLTGGTFNEVLADPYARRVLAGYRHVALTHLPHVDRNWRMPDGSERYCSRLIVPMFTGSTVGLIVAVLAFHDQPILDELAAYAARNRDLPKPTTRVPVPSPRPATEPLPFQRA